MMTGMDDRDDPECDLTLEAMAGLSKILAVVDESNVRHIFINICLRIRPCFVKVWCFQFLFVLVILSITIKKTLFDTLLP